jgi:hypothetical protein
MPNWSDENGRYWYQPEGKTINEMVEIPHAPVGSPEGCTCICCRERPERERRMRGEVQVDFHGRPIHKGAAEHEQQPDLPGELGSDDAAEDIPTKTLYLAVTLAGGSPHEREAFTAEHVREVLENTPSFHVLSSDECFAIYVRDLALT